MKSFLFAFIALSLVISGQTACGKDRITIIETSHKVTHPAAHKGDMLVFQPPIGGKHQQFYVHFDPASHPCEEATITERSDGTIECEVTANATRPDRYLFQMDTDRGDMPFLAKCPPWCPRSWVVILPKSKSDEKQAVPLPTQTSAYPAVEILIFNSDNSPAADAASAYQSQPVTWVKNGSDTKGWSILFKGKNICQEGKTIVSKNSEVAYCTLKNNAAPGYHSYTVTVDGVKGQPSQLFVIPTPHVVLTRRIPSNPQ